MKVLPEHMMVRAAYPEVIQVGGCRIALIKSGRTHHECPKHDFYFYNDAKHGITA